RPGSAPATSSTSPWFAPTSRPPAAGRCARRGPLAGRRRRSAVRGLGARVVRRRHVDAELAEGGAGAGPAVAADEHVGLPRHFSQPVGTRGFLPHPSLLTLLVAPDEGKHDHSEERDAREPLPRPLELR